MFLSSINDQSGKRTRTICESWEKNENKLSFYLEPFKYLLFSKATSPPYVGHLFAYRTKLNSAWKTFIRLLSTLGPGCNHGFFFKAWKKKWFVLRRQTSGGCARLECYRSELACLNGQCKHWIPLKNITSVAEGKSSRTHINIFEICVHKSKYVFSVESLDKRAEWISMIQDVALPKQIKNIPVSQTNIYANGKLLYKFFHGYSFFRLQICDDYCTVVSIAVKPLSTYISCKAIK